MSDLGPVSPFQQPSLDALFVMSHRNFLPVRAKRMRIITARRAFSSQRYDASRDWRASPLQRIATRHR
jgi:hypothetical protein